MLSRIPDASKNSALTELKFWQRNNLKYLIYLFSGQSVFISSQSQHNVTQ